MIEIKQEGLYMTEIASPGIYPGIPNEFYHNSGVGISKSDLDLIHRSPAHFVAGKAEPRKETPAMLLGTVTHAAILEPDIFDSRYIVSPKFDRRTKQGKEEAAAFEAEIESKGLTAIDSDVYEAARNMSKSARDHPIARRLLGTGTAEASVFWHDSDLLEYCSCEPCYMYCKARPDLLLDNMVIDLKTTDDARPEAFRRKIANFRYHVQQAYYSDGIKTVTGEAPNTFVFLVIETTPPHGINIFMLDDDSVELGRTAYKADLQTYIECLKADNWPSYTPEVSVIDLPKWAV